MDLTKQQLFARFQEYYGFMPGPRMLEVEQTTVRNELQNVRHLLARASGERERTLRQKLNRMIAVAQRFNFRTE